VLEYVESVLLVPHSNHAVAAVPFGLTELLSVAPDVDTEVAAFVVTVGMAGITVKLHGLENALHPPALRALTLQ
jgi:hypothetical protein